MSVTFSEGKVAGPVPVSAPQYLVTAPFTGLIGITGEHARLYSVNVMTAEIGGSLIIHDGESVFDAVVAVIDGSELGTFLFGGVRCPHGLYIEVRGASGVYGISAQFSPPPWRTGQLQLDTSAVIDDASRAAAQRWGAVWSAQPIDFPTPDGSCYMGISVQNLFGYGQADSLPVGVANLGTGVTAAANNNVPGPFSPNSFEVTTDGGSADQFIEFLTATGVGAAEGGNALTCSWFKGAAGQSYSFKTKWYNLDASTSESTPVLHTASGEWERVLALEALVTGAGATGDQIAHVVAIDGTRAETFHVVHIQSEDFVKYQAIYVATSQGVATYVQGGTVIFDGYSPALNYTQGWFAIAVRMQMSSAELLASGLALMFCRCNDGVSQDFGLISDSSNPGLNFLYTDGVTPLSVLETMGSWDVGDIMVAICSWNPTEVGVASFGAAFTKLANAGTSISALGADFFIGNESSTTQVNGQVMWAALGDGVLVDDDSALFQSWGGTDPQPGDFPSGASVTMIWPANDATYIII